MPTVGASWVTTAGSKDHFKSGFRIGLRQRPEARKLDLPPGGMPPRNRHAADMRRPRPAWYAT